MIHKFTEGIVNINDFTYQQTWNWINTGWINSKDYNFCIWLRDEVKFNDECFSNEKNRWQLYWGLKGTI